MPRQRIKFALVALGCLAACAVSIAQKKDEWAMNNAMIGPDSPIEMRAGSTYQAQAMYPVPDGPLYPLRAKVTWSIEPAVKGIAIDPGSGKITAGADVAHGTTTLVHANVNNGRRMLKTMLYVFRPEKNPLIGGWSADSKMACGKTQGPQTTGPPQNAFAGLGWRFRADGQFWIGREHSIAARIFLDGKYQLELKQHTLTLTPDWPKGKPPSLWSYVLEENDTKLLLRPLAAEYGSESECSYVLRRLSHVASE